MRLAVVGHCCCLEALVREAFLIPMSNVFVVFEHQTVSVGDRVPFYSSQKFCGLPVPIKRVSATEERERKAKERRPTPRT